MTDLAPATPPPPATDPHAAYWHLVATGAAHRWIALTTDWRVADRLSRQQCILLPGWPTEPATDWLSGPDAAWWWLPVHGRRILITAWTDADAHLATLVMPVIERMRPARLLYRSYLPVAAAVHDDAHNSAPDSGTADTPASRNETTRPAKGVNSNPATLSCAAAGAPVTEASRDVAA